MNAEWLILDTFCSKQNVIRMWSEFLIVHFAESIARCRRSESGSDITPEKKNCFSTKATAGESKVKSLFFSSSADQYYCTFSLPIFNHQPKNTVASTETIRACRPPIPFPALQDFFHSFKTSNDSDFFPQRWQNGVAFTSTLGICTGLAATKRGDKTSIMLSL